MKTPNSQELKPSLEELQANWAQLRLRMLKEKSITKMPSDELRILLELTMQAGTYIEKGAERGKLQALAREIGDAIFQIKTEYPNAAIKPLVDEKARLTSVIHNLPFARNPVFADRRSELEKLHDWLQEQTGLTMMQTVVVHGLGGVGKTQLAIEYAWKFLGSYDAVFFVKADTCQTLDSGLAELTSLLSLPEAGEHDQAIQITALLDWMKGHNRWLLIADNADTESAAEAIQERLPPNLSGAVLITSRRSHWPVIIWDLSLDILLSADASRFLLDRVARAGHDAGDEVAARSLAHELGNLPLALEQAGAAIIEMRLSFDTYREWLRDARPELLNVRREGGTDYPEPVAQTWRVTVDRLSPLACVLLRFAAWFAPEAIPRGLFSAEISVLLEVLEKGTDYSEFAIGKALAELDRWSLIRLTLKTVSVHRLLQAVEQDSLEQEERKRWLLRAARLVNAFAPEQSEDVRTWGIWRPLSPHVETLLEHAKLQGVSTQLITVLTNKLGLFFKGCGGYTQAELLLRRALEIEEQSSQVGDPKVAEKLNKLAEVLTKTNRLKEAEPLYERALAIREKALGSEHSDVAESLNNVALLYVNQGQYAKAEPLYERALMIVEKALGPEHPDVATSLNNLARLYETRGQYAKAKPLYGRALAIREKVFDPNVAQSLNNLAALHYKQGQYAKAGSLFEQALAIREKALGPEHPDVATGLNNLAALYDKQGQYAEAEPLYERALAIWEKALGPEHPNVATGINGLAALCDKQGQYAEAESLYERALAIREKALGPEHPNVATSLNGLAALYDKQGQYAKAEPLYERALAIREKALGPEHPDVATSLNGLAALYDKQGQSAKAEPLYERALAIREKALSSEHPNVATSLNGLAALYDKQGQYAKAEPLYERALAIREKALGPEHPDVATSLNGLAALYNKQGQYAQAEPLYERALAIREKALGPEHPDVAISLNGLAALYDKQGQYAKAEPLYERVIQLQFDTGTGDNDPKLHEATRCYTSLLKRKGLTQTQIDAQLREVIGVFGNDFGQGDC